MAQTGHIENYHKIQIKNARNLEKYIGAKKDQDPSASLNVPHWVMGIVSQR